MLKVGNGGNSYIFEEPLCCDMRDSGEISLPGILPLEICRGPRSKCKTLCPGKGRCQMSSAHSLARPQQESTGLPKVAEGEIRGAGVERGPRDT